MMLKVDVISKAVELEPLRNEWDELLKKSNSNSLFLTFDWIYTWCKVFENRNRQLTILTVKEDRQLLAIAPFYLENGYFKVLKFIGAGDPVYPDYLDLIIKVGYTESAINIIVGKLSELDWDYIQFSDIKADSANLAYLAKYGMVVLGKEYKRPSAECPVIDLPESYEQYLSQISRKQRRKIRNSVHKAQRDFHSIEYRECLYEDLPIALIDLGSLHIKRWVGKTAKFSFTDQKYISFHKQFIFKTKLQNIPRIFALKLNGQTVAMYYIFDYNNIFYYYQSGFDPEFFKYRPGLLLLNKIIQCGIQEKKKTLDFLKGKHAYKEDWTNRTIKTISIFWFKNRVKGRLAFLRKIILPGMKYYQKWIMSKLHDNKRIQ